MRDEARGTKGGGSGARIAGAVYEPRLTLDLPVDETVGTALNALAHAAEALYGGPLEDASSGARIIGATLPEVVADGRNLAARTRLLEGAVHAGRALGERGLFLGHALAQALGGRYGLPHGALNALCLPPALRFNEPVVPEAIAELAQALGVADAAARVEGLGRLGGFGRLRELGVPEAELETVARDVVERGGARANPRPVSAGEALELLRSIW
jgi:alcohol dehydrogenase class IV